jgi:hypothetical protein
MHDISKLSIKELAALICECLSAEGVRATLSGGACAEIYSNSRYVTGDIDFVVNYVSPDNDKKTAMVMKRLGFEKSGRIYINQNVSYSVEFPPGPLGIGDEYHIQPVQIKLSTGNLLLLSATDSVKDRLAGYFYANDLQCLEQAIMICQMNDVDMADIHRWAKGEEKPEKLREFERKIKKLL